MSTIYTINRASTAGRVDNSVFGAALVPIDSRYSGAAELESAMRAAANDAPEFAAPRVERAFHRGAYEAGPYARIGGHDIDGTDAVYVPWHGPIMPEPEQPERIRVEFHYSTPDGARGSWACDNIRDRIVGLADRVHKARAAFDGKARRAPRPKNPPSSATHVAARSMWASGDRIGAIALASNVGAVFFGAVGKGKDDLPHPYMTAEHMRAADVDFVIARSIPSGRFRVLHLETACSADPEGFTSSASAIAWLEERAQCEDWRAKLRSAIASKPTFEQTSARAHYADPDEVEAPDAAPESTQAPAIDAAGHDAPVAENPAPAELVPPATHSDAAPVARLAHSAQIVQTVLGALQAAAPDGMASITGMLSESARLEETAADMRTSAPQYAADCAGAASALRGLADDEAQGRYAAALATFEPVPTMLGFWAHQAARGDKLQPVHAIIAGPYSSQPAGYCMGWSVNLRAAERQATRGDGLRVLRVDPPAWLGPVGAAVRAMAPIDVFDYLADYTDAEPRTYAQRMPHAMRVEMLRDVARTGPAVFWDRMADPPDDPASLDGLDVADLGAEGLAEFDRLQREQATAPASSDARPILPGPVLRIPASDPRIRIPARFAPGYVLRA